MTSTETGLAAVAREIVDTTAYMTLATADGEGRPWATPVWFAHENFRRFFWVSRPETRHSSNLAIRPGLGIVIFDSTVRVNEGQAVYLEAEAAELEGLEREQGLEVFSRRALAHGLDAWKQSQVTRPAAHRLYCARAAQHFLLDDHDRRVPVNPAHRPPTSQ